MADAVRIMPDVIFQDAALCPILSVMLSQKTCRVIPGKVCALSLTAGRIVADRRFSKYGFRTEPHRQCCTALSRKESDPILRSFRPQIMDL